VYGTQSTWIGRHTALQLTDIMQATESRAEGWISAAALQILRQSWWTRASEAVGLIVSGRALLSTGLKEMETERGEKSEGERGLE
jgi:hypothetical protein